MFKSLLVIAKEFTNISLSHNFRATPGAPSTCYPRKIKQSQPKHAHTHTDTEKRNINKETKSKRESFYISSQYNLFHSKLYIYTYIQSGVKPCAMLCIKFRN